MSRDPGDEDRTTFIRLEDTDDGTGAEPVISRAALTLHTAGIVNSVRDGHPGYVSDDYLGAISAETTIRAPKTELTFRPRLIALHEVLLASGYLASCRTVRQDAAQRSRRLHR